MKSYLQGLITGAVFVFAFLILIGTSDSKPDNERYQVSISGAYPNRTIIMDTRTGIGYERVIKDSNNDWTINYVAYEQFKTAGGY